MPRKAARTDDNQNALVALFRAAGASVLHTHQLGDGAPDIIVGAFGVNCLVEIKDGAKPPSKRKLTKDEKDFKNAWRGWYAIVESAEDARRLLSDMAKGARKQTAL